MDLEKQNGTPEPTQEEEILVDGLPEEEIVEQPEDILNAENEPVEEIEAVLVAGEETPAAFSEVE